LAQSTIDNPLNLAERFCAFAAAQRSLAIEEALG
jgi:hypothetical protein